MKANKHFYSHIQHSNTSESTKPISLQTIAIKTAQLGHICKLITVQTAQRAFSFSTNSSAIVHCSELISSQTHRLVIAFHANSSAGTLLSSTQRIRAAGGRQRTGGVDTITIHSSFAAAPCLPPFPLSGNPVSSQ
jgi:hypothetical protein